MFGNTRSEMTITERRELIIMRSAVAMLIAAVLFAGAGFCTYPIGEIHSSVQWICAQFLIYAGSALGITTYLRSELRDMRKDIEKKEDKK